MATIAIGDIHGNLRALNDVLDRLRGEATSGDTVVFLGDYIDRGPDSKGCIDAVLNFRNNADAEVVCLLGNHEDWFLRTLRDRSRHSWLLGMEAFETIRSYSTEAEKILRDAQAEAGIGLYGGWRRLPYEAFFDSVPAEHIRFFEGLRLYHRTADCVCTHGGMDPRIADVERQTRDALIWGGSTFPNGYDCADLIVYGLRDTVMFNVKRRPAPRIVGRTIGIDTISQGVLTAIRLPDRQLFQSARHDTKRRV